MQSSTTIPSDLLREIQRGNCIPFIGSGVASEANVGILNAWELALKLATECEQMDPDYYNYEKHRYDRLDEVAEDFIAIADKIFGERGRARLEEVLRREVTRAGIRRPRIGTSSYPFIANIPWQKAEGPLIITTNWDELLEDAVFRYAGRDFDVILEDADLPRLGQDRSRIKLIKLHGTISRPETLMVTQSDYDRVKKEVKTVGLFEYVGNLLATRTILFAGYSLRDSNFRFLYTLVEEATEKAGRPYAPTHYAILGEEPDPYDKAQWEKKGVIFLPVTARKFFQQVFIETNKFINRDEQRRLHRLEYAPLYALIGPAGVGKSTLLRRINDDLEMERGEQARRYRYHLFYRFPRPEPLTPESRCLDLLGALAKELNYPLPDIISEARRRASEEERPESLLRQELLNNHLDRLKLKFAEPTLLLFDCTTRLDPGIMRFLERLLEPALEGSRLRAIIASRYPLEWSHPQLRRLFRTNTEKLVPFTEIDVTNWLQYQALLEADIFLEPEASRKAGRRIIQLTRGHPEAIKRVISHLSEDPARLQDGQRIIDFIRAHEPELVEDTLEVEGRVPTLDELGKMASDLAGGDTNVVSLVNGLRKEELWAEARQLAQGETIPFSRIASAPSRLELLGLIRDEGGRCAVRNPIYEEIIRCGEEANALRLEDIRPGAEDAKAYEQCVFEMLCRFFAGQLSYPERESKTVGGTERRDIIFLNASSHEFWRLVGRQHAATHIVFECKNTESLKLDHVNQLVGYLGQPLGNFGVIVSRLPPGENLQRKAITAFNRNKKVVLFLSDKDLVKMAQLEAQGGDPTEVIERKYVKLTRWVQ